ncbi:hypothetical protein Micbo1qcDRAFT_169295, partial [Microdochium bolleyi]
MGKCGDRTTPIRWKFPCFAKPKAPDCIRKVAPGTASYSRRPGSAATASSARTRSSSRSRAATPASSPPLSTSAGMPASPRA